MKTFTIQDARAILVELGVPDKVVFGSPQPIALKAADRLLQSMSKSMVISCPNRKNWIIN
nr:hypothetical protein [Vibrio splendidus]